MKPILILMLFVCAAQRAQGQIPYNKWDATMYFAGYYYEKDSTRNNRILSRAERVISNEHIATGFDSVLHVFQTRTNISLDSAILSDLKAEFLGSYALLNLMNVKEDSMRDPLADSAFDYRKALVSTGYEALLSHMTQIAEGEKKQLLANWFSKEDQATRKSWLEALADINKDRPIGLGWNVRGNQTAEDWEDELETPLASRYYRLDVKCDVAQCQVWINGEEQPGTTNKKYVHPIRGVRMDIEVRITRDGYKDFVKRYTVKADKWTEVSAKLVKE